MNEIKTVTVDTYPIRYAASENHGVWVESTHSFAGSPGQEIACYFEPDDDTQDNPNGLYVSIVNHAGLKKIVALCEVNGPKYDQRKNMHFVANTLDEAKSYAVEWLRWAKSFEFSPDNVDPYPVEKCERSA